MMMLPRRNEFNLLDDIFGDLDYTENKIMKTDIKEHKDNYSILIDLPGYNKEDIKISVDDGYLTISATMSKNEEEKEHGKFVRRERYFGECSRSFYVGDNVEVDDIKASFKNGTLNLSIPKKEQKQITEKKYVQIED